MPRLVMRIPPERSANALVGLAVKSAHLCVDYEKEKQGYVHCHDDGQTTETGHDFPVDFSFGEIKSINGPMRVRANAQSGSATT